MKYFDEKGAEFEADKDWNKILPSLPDGHIVIRPIAEPKKWKVELQYMLGKGDIFIALDDVHADQAQLIKEAVEALMGQIFSDTDRLVLIDAITEARRSLQKGAE